MPPKAYPEAGTPDTDELTRQAVQALRQDQGFVHEWNQYYRQRPRGGGYRGGPEMLAGVSYDLLENIVAGIVTAVISGATTKLWHKWRGLLTELVRQHCESAGIQQDSPLRNLIRSRLVVVLSPIARAFRRGSEGEGHDGE